MTEDDDNRWMGRALVEAARGVGGTAPNPPVGAVVVKDGEATGKGFHARAGAPHAEVVALQAAGSGGCQGATLYVTLEPCSTHGRTPPCCDAIRAAGIRRVVYATDDPNPEHAGRALAVLGAAGIGVERGVREEEAKDLIRGFAKRVTTGMPWVIAKAGLSLDGKLTRPPGEGQWLTGEAARRDAHFLRLEADAIVVGARTVREDDPALTVRGPAADATPEQLQPWRVVMTRSGDLPEEARLFSDEHRGRTLVFKGEAPEMVLERLGRDHGCNTVLVEGGGQILGQFFAGGLVDEVVFYYAPLWCGSGTVAADGGVVLPASVVLEDIDVQKIGAGTKIRGRVART
jgi:diaminohydroxyphosphoribosylaminopyrimidine deaminase/5-amino-6-(5-phosphoribosylamino)uracil reductase